MAFQKNLQLFCIFCVQGGYNFSAGDSPYGKSFFFFGFNWILIILVFLMVDFAAFLVTCKILHKYILLWCFTIFYAYIKNQNSIVINM